MPRSRLRREPDLRRADAGNSYPSTDGCVTPGLSGAQSGRPQWAIEERMRTHMHTPESGRVFVQSQQWRRCIQQQRRHADMIGHQMTGLLFRVTNMEGAVVVMMMGFVLPVQHRVLEVGQRRHRNAATRQCHGLPQHGKQHGDENGTA
jgi:hypothetical protein